MIVYIATNRENGKVYIGQTVRTFEQRKAVHISKSKSGNRNYFHNAIRKYGADNFKWEVIRICDSIKSLNAFEQYYILYYNSMNEGYNLTSGGLNHRMSKETKQKMSKARLKYYAENPDKILSGKNSHTYRRKHTKKETLLMSQNHKDFSGKNNPFYSKTHSEESKLKNRISQLGKNSSRYGKSPSEETRKKMSISQKQAWKIRKTMEDINEKSSKT